MFGLSFPTRHLNQKRCSRPGTPVDSTLPCLFSHLPHEIHLVVLEFGSMARLTTMPAVEATLRVLLSLPSRPAILFLSFREFCVASKVAWRRTLFPPDEVTPHVRAERAFAALCRHYGASCLSYAEAVSPGLYANRSGFTLDDVAPDCLHPDQGRYGNGYVSDILRHWLRQAARRVRSATPTTGPADAWRLPPPCNASCSAAAGPGKVRGAGKVLRLQAEADGSARCYSFGRRHALGLHQRSPGLRPIPWDTASCRVGRAAAAVDPAGFLDRLSHPTGRPGKNQLKGQAAAAHGSSALTDSGMLLGDCVRPKHIPECRPGTLRSPPDVWIYCYQVLTPSGLGKVSPGVMAFAPGATLTAVLDTRMESAIAAPAAAAAAAGAAGAAGGSVLASLSYVSSYENQGRLTVRCARGCRCEEQRLDAHRTYAAQERNVSVVEEHAFVIAGASAMCELQLQVRRATSSGGHQFQLRGLKLRAPTRHTSQVTPHT